MLAFFISSVIWKRSQLSESKNTRKRLNRHFLSIFCVVGVWWVWRLRHRAIKDGQEIREDQEGAEGRLLQGIQHGYCRHSVVESSTIDDSVLRLHSLSSVYRSEGNGHSCLSTSPSVCLRDDERRLQYVSHVLCLWFVFLLLIHFTITSVRELPSNSLSYSPLPIFIGSVFFMQSISYLDLEADFRVPFRRLHY